MFHDDDVSNERGKPFVYDVAFSYDAKRLLVGGRDGVGRIWDCNIEDTFYVAKLLISLEAHASAVLAVAWSADAKDRDGVEGPDVQGLLGEDGAHSIGPDGPRGPGHIHQILPGGRAFDGRLAPPGPRSRRRAMLPRFWRVAPETRGWTPRKEVERDVRGHSAGHVDRIAVSRSTRRASWSRRLDRKAIVWDVQQNQAGHGGAAGRPRRRDGGRADGGWRMRGAMVACLRHVTQRLSTTSGHPAAVAAIVTVARGSGRRVGSPKLRVSTEQVVAAGHELLDVAAPDEPVAVRVHERAAPPVPLEASYAHRM